MGKIGRCGVNGHSPASSRPASSLMLSSLLFWGIDLPFAQATASDWAVYTRILILAAVLCLIAVIVLAVPALSDYLRRWRENRHMYSVMHPTEPSEPSPQALEQIARIVETKTGTRDALGWSVEDKASAAAKTPDRASDEQGGDLGGRKTILIADDDPIVVQALSRRLQHIGYQVLRSPDAAHALLGAMKARPDLIILDVNMPAGNGLAVCEMMASDPRYADIPVVIHSVINDDATKERAKRLGAYFVEKSPRSWGAIKELVQTLIGGEKPSSPESATEQVASDELWAADQAEARETGERQVRQEMKAPAVTPPVAEKPAPARRSTSVQVESSGTSPTCGRPRVLCIESPKDRLEFVEHQLSALGIEVTRTSDLEEGFWTCFTEKPQVVIIQAAENKKPLQGLLDRLSQHPVTRMLPVLLIDENNVISASGLPGAVNLRVLTYPMDWEDLLGELEALLPIFGRREEEGILMKIADSSPAEGPTEEMPPITTTGSSAVSEGEERPLRILCVDDDPVVARAISIRLQPYGITVISANNGTQGHLMAVTEQPDLILLDLKMPKGEGNYVLSKLKEGSRTEHIPVIILTVESHPGVKRQLISVGAAAFLSKPIRWPLLFEEMARCVKMPKQLLDDYRISPPLTHAEL